MLRIAGRSPKASVQISTPGCEPVGGWKNAASHVPSGVLIVTSVSTTGGAAPNAEPAAAARPAVTDNAMKSRRERSVPASSGFFESRLSSMAASPLDKSAELEFPVSNLSWAASNTAPVVSSTPALNNSVSLVVVAGSRCAARGETPHRRKRRRASRPRPMQACC